MSNKTYVLAALIKMQSDLAALIKEVEHGGEFITEPLEQVGGNHQKQPPPRDPLAKSITDLVTPRQLGMIRALAREVGVDADEECQSVLRCKTEELSKRAASSLIDHLGAVKRERKSA